MAFITETPQAYFEGYNVGGYRYISLQDIVNNFMVAYVGDGKVLDHVRRTDVIFHAKRCIQEFTYDITGTPKPLELTIPPSLSIAMPQDFVDIDSVFWIDSDGIKHVIYEGDITANPESSPIQDGSGDFVFDGNGELIEGSPITPENFKNFDIKLLTGGHEVDDYRLSDYDASRRLYFGGRFGAEPETTQINGFYFIDVARGKISFSSDLSRKLIVLNYISDGMATDDDMKVHKFAEEAIYRYIRLALSENRDNIPEYQIRRFKKDFVAARKNAKIRLSNFNPREMIQIMRGKSKPIK